MGDIGYTLIAGVVVVKHYDQEKKYETDNSQ
jgi:hypothetical protein